MRGFSKKQIPPKKLQDIFFDPKKSTLHLRERTWKIEFTRKEIPSFFRHHLWLSLVSLSFFVGLTTLMWGKANPIKADTIVFYPTTCLGGWKNPQYAQGKPEVSQNVHTDTDYTVNNSAVLDNSVAQIFCGGFDGEIPADTEPKKVVVSFSWTLKNESNPLPSGPVLITSENASSTLSAILDSSSTTPITITNTPVSSSSTTIINVPASPSTSPVLEAAPLPSPESPQPQVQVSTSSPVTFFQTFIPHVFAEEVSTSTEASTSPLLATSTSSVVTSDNFLEVLYTLDGTNWQTLGGVRAADFNNTSFVLPASAYVVWKDLSKLQIQIRSLATLDNPGTVYLDAVKVEVAYDSQNGVQAPEDLTAYKVSAISNQFTNIGTTVTEEGNQQSLLFKGKSGTSFRFYKNGDSSFSLITGVGNELVTMPTYFFKEGDFVLINTNEVTGCASLTLSECRADPGFIDETNFSVSKIHKLQDNLIQ